MLDGEIFGLPIPTQEPVFATALAIHVAFRLTAAVAGAVAATARKHPDATRAPAASTC